MPKKEYILKAKCIWCLKTRPETTFLNKPHTISKKLGSKKVGFDVCDNCNTYFGTEDNNSKYKIPVELAFKEIFNVSRFLLKLPFGINNEAFRSRFFDFYKSKKTMKIRYSFRLNDEFLRKFTRQFKRGVYEVFLQEYHRVFHDGHNEKFNKIREFVRYDKGNIPLHFLDNNGIYFTTRKIDPSFIYKEDERNIKYINDFGFYIAHFFGHILFLEVTPRAVLSREIFLKNQEKIYSCPGYIYKGIKELNYITDLDFTLRKLFRKK